MKPLTFKNYLARDSTDSPLIGNEKWNDERDLLYKATVPYKEKYDDKTWMVIDLFNKAVYWTLDPNSVISKNISTNKLHRTNGPAYMDNIGFKSWWVNGKRHREDGPAIESERSLISFGDAKYAYFVHNVEMREKEYEQWCKAHNETKKGSKEAGVNLDV